MKWALSAIQAVSKLKKAYFKILFFYKETKALDITIFTPFLVL